MKSQSTSSFQVNAKIDTGKTAPLNDTGPSTLCGEPVTASHILSQAESVLRERASQRDCEGTGERNMSKVVASFNAMTGHTLTEADGWQFMMLLKMVRARIGAARIDDYLDMASYSALLGECRLKS